MSLLFGGGQKLNNLRTKNDVFAKHLPRFGDGLYRLSMEEGRS